MGDASGGGAAREVTGAAISSVGTDGLIVAFSDLWKAFLFSLLHTSSACSNRRITYPPATENLMTKQGKSIAGPTLTTPAAASRAQSAVARTKGGVIPSNSYVTRLQRAAAINFGKSGSK